MFGIELIDAGLMPAMIIALVAGVISFLSPCVLPIVPPYLAYMSGVSVSDLNRKEGPRSAVVPALFFVLGLSTVFLLLGFAASALGKVLLSYSDMFSTVAGIIVMIFGAHFIGIYRIGFLDREARLDVGDQGGSSMGAYVLGLAFAFGWTPCIGPILGAILTASATSATIGEGVALLAVYSAGLGIPFLVVAGFTDSIAGRLRGIGRWGRRLHQAAGGVMILMGLAMMTGRLSALAYWLLDTFPVLARIG